MMDIFLMEFQRFALNAIIHVKLVQAMLLVILALQIEFRMEHTVHVSLNFFKIQEI